MNIAIITIYSVGCIVAMILGSMVIECWANNGINIHNREEERQASSAVAITSLGSWIAVAWIWTKNKEEIKWTWKKWTRKL